MNSTILALALTMSAAFSVSATATEKYPTATPAWGCRLQAKVSQDDSFNMILIKADDFTAKGKLSCVAWNGQKRSAKVIVRLKGVGIGVNLTAPKEEAGLWIYGFKAGVSTPNGMYGKYRLGVGPGVTLFATRIGAAIGGEVTPGKEVAGFINLNFRELMGLGVDISAYTMTISPAN